MKNKSTMENNVIEILKFLNENVYATAPVVQNGQIETLDACYDLMKRIAKENNCFIQFGGTLHKAEKFYFTWEGKLYRWSLIWAPQPYYIFELTTETSHKSFEFKIEEQAE